MFAQCSFYICRSRSLVGELKNTNIKILALSTGRREKSVLQTRFAMKPSLKFQPSLPESKGNKFFIVGVIAVGEIEFCRRRQSCGKKLRLNWCLSFDASWLFHSNSQSRVHNETRSEMKRNEHLVDVLLSFGKCLWKQKLFLIWSCYWL